MFDAMNRLGGPYGRYVNDIYKCIMHEEWNLCYMSVKNTILVEESEKC
jgi:hypothetical protein